MKRERIYLVFVFLLLIPYLCSLTMVGICYNALVRHSSNLWRTLVGALVGALIMFAIKATIQRPLDLISKQIPQSFFKQLLRFFSIRRRKLFLIGNFVLDFILCIIATILVRKFLALKVIVDTSTGWTLLVMLISTCIGAYLEYDNLSIDPQQH
ncbi:hypothetical protein J2Z60_000775 [Lactobacillus colini]|uniref:Integral membrane protein n=1 Tax=Lactobacillus colini TaxID=1819254 RepID=A0ABS4MDZ2_9LACO|nr:hypothetical protein [Lactobacillus colini]MBP2057604.1 hypothetical protein [Lactobacillus colini]